MDTSEIIVVTGSVALIGAVLWYFFGERTQTVAPVSDSGVQEVRVTVKGGYSPDVVVVKQGLPVRMVFYRDEAGSCTEQVIFGDFGIARDLPAFQTTNIEFTPDKSGEFIFACGMNMVRGTLIVQP